MTRFRAEAAMRIITRIDDTRARIKKLGEQIDECPEGHVYLPDGTKVGIISPDTLRNVIALMIYEENELLTELEDDLEEL